MAATDQPCHPLIGRQTRDGMAITPGGKTVLVLTGTGVTPVDAATNRAGKPVAIEGAHALAVAPGGVTAYVLAQPNPDSHQPFVVPLHIRPRTPANPIQIVLTPP